MSDTPNYIKSLLIPTNGSQPRARRVWSIELESVLVPFFTATNTMGDTAIPSDALGAPVRLAYEKDGSVKFSKSGKPVTKVAKEIADSVRLMRENFISGLTAYAGGVANANPDGYKAQIAIAREAGEPIVSRDRANLDKAMAEAVARDVELAQARAKKTGKVRVAVPA